MSSLMRKNEKNVKRKETRIRFPKAKLCKSCTNIVFKKNYISLRGIENTYINSFWKTNADLCSS